MVDIELTRAAWAVLRADAQREMETVCCERLTLRGGAKGARQEQILLALADVLRSLSHWAPGETAHFRFTDQALGWIEQTHMVTEGHLEHLITPEEGPLDYAARQAHLVRVTGRILEVADQHDEVTV